jgi:branched-chain amino acid transport system substrate-binding protein
MKPIAFRAGPIMRTLLPVLAFSILLPAAVRAQQVIKVGAVLPLTGPAASLGAMSREGVLAAAKFINDNGGIKALNGAKIEPVIRDHAGKADVARATAQSLIEDEKVVAILGFQTSDVSIVGSQACAIAGVPCLSVDATTVITERGQGSVYRVFPSIAQYGTALVSAASDFGMSAGTKVAILTVQGALGTASAAAIKAAAEQRGWNVVANIDYPAGTTRDFVPLATSLKSSGAQAVFALSYGEAPQVLQAMQQVAYRPQVYGVSAGFATQAFITTLKQDANFVHVSAGFSPDLAEKSPTLAQLVAAYSAANSGAKPGVDFFQYLSLMTVLKSGLENAGSTDKVKLNAALHALEMKFGDPLVATVGGVKFNASGDNIAVQAPVLQIQDAKQVIVWPPSVATAKTQKTPASW